MKEKRRINNDSQVSGLCIWVSGGTIYETKKNLEWTKFKFTFIHVKIEMSKWRCTGGSWI